MTVGELKERLDRDFQDTDEISFEVCLHSDCLKVDGSLLKTRS